MALCQCVKGAPRFYACAYYRVFLGNPIDFLCRPGLDTGMHSIDHIRPEDKETGLLNVIVETPRGSRCKHSYDTELGVFRLKKCLPAGTHFPYDFGFIPGTLAEDGDPLDVLIISQYKTFTGCLIPVRLIGVLEAKQSAPPLRGEGGRG